MEGKGGKASQKKAKSVPEESSGDELVTVETAVTLVTE